MNILLKCALWLFIFPYSTLFRSFLRGICMHEEAPFRGGRAYSREDALTLLGWARELGANFVRLAHYPHNELIVREDRKSTRLNSSHLVITYAVFCFKKKSGFWCI